MVIFNFWTAPHLHVCIRHLSPMTTKPSAKHSAKSEGTFCWNFNSQFSLKAVQFFYNNVQQQQCKTTAWQENKWSPTGCIRCHAAFHHIPAAHVPHWNSFSSRLILLKDDASHSRSSRSLSSVQRGFIGVQVSIKILRKNQNIICLSAEKCVWV